MPGGKKIDIKFELKEKKINTDNLIRNLALKVEELSKENKLIKNEQEKLKEELLKKNNEYDNIKKELNTKNLEIQELKKELVLLKNSLKNIENSIRLKKEEDKKNINDLNTKNNLKKKEQEDINTNINKEDIKIEEILSNDEEYDNIIKIALIGDSGTGKTNLLKRFNCDNFREDSKATVGVEFLTKSFRINDSIFKIEFWDTSGQERYKSITSTYYKGAKGVFLIYDITSIYSFNIIDKWIREIESKCSTDLKVMIIGNKLDRKDERQVTYEKGSEKAKSIGASFMEVSALDNYNVKEAFFCLIKEIYKEQIKKINY